MRIQREGAELQPRGMRSAGPGDDQARFLADLRALRDAAAIGYDELAARAHYPSGLLKEAENGPSLPSLPILAAYVRACEGNVPEWEERWRKLGVETRADPNLPVRPAGASAAAVAGARAGIGVTPPEAYDPERIRAALRGAQRRSVPGACDSAARAGTSAAWDGSVTQDASTNLDTGGAWGGGAGQEASAQRDSGGAWGGGVGQEAGTRRDAGENWDTRTAGDIGEGWDVGISRDTRGGWDTSTQRDVSAWDTGTKQDGGNAWDASTSRDTGEGWDTSTQRDVSAWDTSTSRNIGEGWDINVQRDVSASRGTGDGWETSAQRDVGASRDGGTDRESGGDWFSDASGADAGWENAASQGAELSDGIHHAERPSRGPFEAANTSSPDTVSPATGQAERTAYAEDRAGPAAYADDRTTNRVADHTAYADDRTTSRAADHTAYAEDRTTSRAERAAYADGRAERAALAGGLEGDAVERARAIRSDPFSASWLQDSEVTSRSEDGRFSWLEPTSRPRGGELPTEGPAGERAAQPGAARAVGEPAKPAGPAAAGQGRGSAERKASTATAVPQPRNRRRSRAVSMRLLLLVVLAALIGSAVMLLFR
jgi:hypothetical protein